MQIVLKASTEPVNNMINFFFKMVTHLGTRQHVRNNHPLECPDSIAAFAALVVAHEGVKELVVRILYVA